MHNLISTVTKTVLNITTVLPLTQGDGQLLMLHNIYFITVLLHDSLPTTCPPPRPVDAERNGLLMAA